MSLLSYGWRRVVAASGGTSTRTFSLSHVARIAAQSEAEVKYEQIVDILKDKFRPTNLQVQDVSGVCMCEKWLTTKAAAAPSLPSC